MLDREVVDVDAFEKYVKEQGWELIYVSAATGAGLKELIKLCDKTLQTLPPLKIYESEQIDDEVAAVDGKQTIIRRENEKYIVEGEWLLNLMGQINFDDWESLTFFQKVLQKSGVFTMLEAKGCSDGDTVSIYDFEFDYVK